MKTALTFGPVGISLDSDKNPFRHYTGGVIKSISCGDDIGHAVLAVGYGKDAEGDDYVIIKNSHGTSWGQNGFGMISMSQKYSISGYCGVLKQGGDYAKVSNPI
jgi:C1A family cysteine protease